MGPVRLSSRSVSYTPATNTSWEAAKKQYGVQSAQAPFRILSNLQSGYTANEGRWIIVVLPRLRKMFLLFRTKLVFGMNYW
jgi:hypothetical protein